MGRQRVKLAVNLRPLGRRRQLPSETARASVDRFVAARVGPIPVGFNAVNKIAVLDMNRRDWDRLVERQAKRLKREQSPAEREEIERLRHLHDLPLDAAWHTINAALPTPDVVLEAVVAAVMERGLEALEEPKNLDRVDRLDEIGKREARDYQARLMATQI